MSQNDFNALERAPVRRASAFSLDEAARANRAHRNVVYTDAHHQVALMSVSLAVPYERHLYSSQSVHVADGQAVVTIDGATVALGPGQAVFVPAGAMHRIDNAGSNLLKIWVTYSPPVHGPLDYQRVRGQ